MFASIMKKGSFVVEPGVRSNYTYEFGLMSDGMCMGYSEMLKQKLESWQEKHGKFDVVIGIETQGIRIGYQLSQLMGLPFHIAPKKRIDFAQLKIPSYPPDAHWLIVDDIVTTGSTFIRTVNYLEIEEKPESVTFACMIRRNPDNLDFSAVTGDPEKEQFQVRSERFEFIDQRTVSLYSEMDGRPG